MTRLRTNPHSLPRLVRDMAQWIMICEEQDRFGNRQEYVHDRAMAQWAERLMFAGPDNQREDENRESAIRMAWFIYKKLAEEKIIT